jgi:hypothetical protein
MPRRVKKKEKNEQYWNQQGKNQENCIIKKYLPIIIINIKHLNSPINT